MRSAPTLNSWMMPFSSVAMIEKLALVRIAFCKAPVFSNASWRRTSVMPCRLAGIVAGRGTASSLGHGRAPRSTCARRAYKRTEAPPDFWTLPLLPTGVGTAAHIGRAAVQFQTDPRIGTRSAAEVHQPDRKRRSPEDHADRCRSPDLPPIREQHVLVLDAPPLHDPRPRRPGSNRSPRATPQS